MAQSRGIDIKLSADGSLIFAALLLDSSNAKVTTGATGVRLWHVVPTDGSLTGYDFADNTFKTGAPTTATSAAAHQTVAAASYDTGVWTLRLATLTGFTIGDQYIVEVANSGASPSVQQRLFQYGGAGIEDVAGKVLGGASGTIAGAGAWAYDHEGAEVANAGDAMTLTAGERTSIASGLLTSSLVAYEVYGTGLRVADILVALRAVLLGKLTQASASSLAYWSADGATVVVTIPNIGSDYASRGTAV